MAQELTELVWPAKAGDLAAFEQLSHRAAAAPGGAEGGATPGAPRAELSGGSDRYGRRTYLLSLCPRYAGNPSRRLWIDAQTGLILKQERYDAEGLLTMPMRAA